MKIGQKWKLDKLKSGQIKNWPKLKIDQNWKLTKIENWQNLIIGQKLKIVKGEEQNRFVEARGAYLKMWKIHEKMTQI